MTAIAKRVSTQPFTFKCFEASTGHISKNDTELLDRDDSPATSYKFEYGWFIYTGAGEYTEHEFDAMTKFGFSNALIRLIQLAVDNNCKFLQLDCDGFVYEDLAKFDW